MGFHQLSSDRLGEYRAPIVMLPSNFGVRVEWPPVLFRARNAGATERVHRLTPVERFAPSFRVRCENCSNIPGLGQAQQSGLIAEVTCGEGVGALLQALSHQVPSSSLLYYSRA